MEKYYFGNLTGDSITTTTSRLVELNFERRPPSFGILYLEFSTEHPAEHQERTRSRRRAPKFASHLSLKVLELPPDRSEAIFKTTKRFPLNAELKVVDFDSDQVIFISDHQEGASAAVDETNHEQAAAVVVGRKRPAAAAHSKIECILLDDGGNLHTINLTDGSVKCVTIEASCSAPLAGKPVQCKLVNNQNEDCTVHVLKEKCHLSYKLSGANNINSQLISRYNLLSNQRFTRLMINHFGNQNPTRAIVAELSDASAMILHNSECLAHIKSHEDDDDDDNNTKLHLTEHHLLLGNEHSGELLLLSSSGNRIIAHSILIGEQQVNAHVSSGNRDPDRLLPEEPPFELEKCWTFDLGDISNLRYLIESDRDQSESAHFCMCPIWSPLQQSPTCWPKFVLVTYRYHLLVLSFEQEPVQPFSVIYDRNFLKVTPMTVKTSSSNDNQPPQQHQEEHEFIDAKMRPKLLHNIKLIGPKPSDSLFNNTFLTNKRQTSASSSFVKRCRHFPQMAIVVALMSTGEFLAFKLAPDTIKESLYQKLVGDSLRTSTALLRDQIDWLEDANRKLATRAANLENNRPNNEAQEENPQKVVCVELRADNRTANLYNLSMFLTCPELINEMIIMSSVPGSRLILPPNLIGIAFAETEGDNLRNQRIIIDLRREESINSMNNQYDLQVFIPSYSTGSIDIYTVFGPEMRQCDDDDDDDLEDNCRYCLDSLAIGPLVAYHRQSSFTSSDGQPPGSDRETIEIRGNIKADTIRSWLADCFGEDIVVFDNNSHLRLEFPLAGHFIQFVIRESETLQVTANDRVALDLVRKTILRRATDASLKLTEMSPWSPPPLPPPADKSPIPELNRTKALDLEGCVQIGSEQTLLETILSECQQQNDFMSDACIESELRKEIQVAMRKSLATSS